MAPPKVRRLKQHEDKNAKPSSSSPISRSIRRCSVITQILRDCDWMRGNQSRMPASGFLSSAIAIEFYTHRFRLRPIASDYFVVCSSILCQRSEIV